MTGDPSAFEARSAPSCTVCAAAAHKARANAKEHGHTRSNPYRVAVRTSNQESTRRLVTLDVSYDDYRYYDDDGTSTGKVSGDAYDIVLTLSHDREWTVDNWVLVRRAK